MSGGPSLGGKKASWKSLELQPCLLPSRQTVLTGFLPVCACVYLPQLLFFWGRHPSFPCELFLSCQERRCPLQPLPGTCQYLASLPPWLAPPASAQCPDNTQQHQMTQISGSKEVPRLTNRPRNKAAENSHHQVIAPPRNSENKGAIEVK